MKNISLYIAAFASTTLLFSCAKELENQVEEEPQGGSFEYVFRVAEENSDATKTTLDGVTVKWESGDDIGVYAEGTTNATGEITTLNPVEFPVKLTAALSTGDKVYCYYPYSTGNNAVASNAINLSIRTSQTGDFDAMPQISLPYETTSDMAAGTTNVADIRICNLGSVARFFVYSTGGFEGETVESITFNADKALAGSFTFDLTSVDYDTPSTLEISGYTAKSVKLIAAPAVGTSSSNAGTAEMVIAPGTYYGTIVVRTDVAVYTYTIAEANKITFSRSKIKKLGLDLKASETCTRELRHPVGEVFVPATSIVAGDKILIASGTDGTVGVFGTDRGNNRLGYQYDLEGGAIISTADTYPLTVAAGITNSSYFTLYDIDTDGYIAAASSSNNYMKTKAAIDVNAEWQIALDGTSKATTFNATGSSYTNKYFRYNGGNTPPLFSAYASGKQSDVYVFKKSTDTFVSAANQNIAYNVTSVTIPYNVYNASGTTTVAFKTNPNTCASNLAINEDTKQVTFDITVNDGETRTVEVNITNNDVTKTVTINQAAGAGGDLTFTISSSSVVTANSYTSYALANDGNGRSWVITFGGNGKSVGTNYNKDSSKDNRKNCNLSSYEKYAVSPITTSTTASVFANTSSISNVKKIKYTIGETGSNQNSTKVYLLYSSDNTTFSQMTLTAGTQGSTISSGTTFEFSQCSGYFAVLFESTNSNAAWRIDDVELEFTYTE